MTDVARAFGAIATAAAVAVTGCANHLPYAEVRELQRLTTPAQGIAGPATSAAAHGWTWDLTADQSWASYASWVQRQIPDSYGVRFTTPTSLTFRRILDGDVYELRMRPVSGGTSLTVTSTFTATPF